MMISKIFKITFVVLVFGLFTSCGDDDTPAEAPNVKFRATVNGESFRTDNTTATLTNEGKVITIVGVSETGNQTITIRVGSTEEDAPLIMSQAYNTASEEIPASIRYSFGTENFQTNLETTGVITLNSFDLDPNFIFGSFSGELANTMIPTESIMISNGALTGVTFTVQ